MTVGRPHTLLGASAEFREDLDDEAQLVFEVLWRRGDPQTFCALGDGEDAVDAALLFARSQKGRFLRPSSRLVFERAFAAIERAGLAELDRERDTGRVVEARMCATSAERAWMARVAARQALLTANDPAPGGAAAGDGPAPAAPSPPTRRQRENLRTSIARWIERWLREHPEEVLVDGELPEARRAELEAHYLAHVYSPGKVGRKPRANGTQSTASSGNDTRPAAANGTPAIASSLREGGERESLSLSPISGESDARATPRPNDTQPNDTQGRCVSLPPEPPRRPPAAEHPPRSSEPAPPPEKPLDYGAQLVAALREGAGDLLGPGSDERLGDALLALHVDLRLARLMGELAGAKELPGQKVDEKGDPREFFPVGLLLAGRSSDSKWLPSWVGHAKAVQSKRARQARAAAEHEAAKRRPVAQQRLGMVGDNTVPPRGTGPPAAAPADASRPGLTKSFAEMTEEERRATFNGAPHRRSPK